MNVTVTGGTGFIGKQLVDSLVADDVEVHIIGRRPRTGIAPHIRFSLWDAESGEPSPESVGNADVVVHLAGEPVAQRWTPEVKRRIEVSRVEGARRLVAALANLPSRPSTLVAASAIGYYGSRGDEVLTEDSAPGEGFLPEVCQRWETEMDRAAELGMRVVKLRLGIVLGRGGGALAQMLPAFKMMVGGQIGNGRQWMSWVHIDDVVRLIRFAIDTPRLRGAVNATAPNPVRNSQFTKLLARTIRRPALFTVPEAGLRLLFGDMAGVMTASQRVLPKAAQAAGYEFRWPELGTALKDLLT